MLAVATEGRVLNHRAEARLEQQPLVQADHRRAARRACGEQVRVVLGSLRVLQREVELEKQEAEHGPREHPHQAVDAKHGVAVPPQDARPKAARPSALATASAPDSSRTTPSALDPRDVLGVSELFETAR